MFISYSLLIFSSQQEENLQRVKKGDMKASVHRMEIDRIRFVLSSYLRARLQKVCMVNDIILQMKSSHFPPSLLS